jgi:hypothetical protein
MAQTTKSSYVSSMVVLRHMMVSLLTLALSIGTGWQSSARMQENPASPSAALASHTDLHQGGGHHQHAMSNSEALGELLLAMAVNGQPESVHACMKCCGACMLTSVIPVGPGSTVAQAITRITFASLIEQLRGRVVVVDPDIPKHIV